MKVTVFGIGYVGLVQGAVLADAGHDVMCVDIDSQKIEDLKNGIVPIYEPGLAPIVEQNYKEGRLQFTTDAADGVDHGQIQFIVQPWILRNIIVLTVGTAKIAANRGNGIGQRAWQ